MWPTYVVVIMKCLTGKGVVDEDIELGGSWGGGGEVKGMKMVGGMRGFCCG